MSSLDQCHSAMHHKVKNRSKFFFFGTMCGAKINILNFFVEFFFRMPRLKETIVQDVTS